MFPLAMMPLSVYMFITCAAGLCLGGLVNWAIYRLAWHQRDISPWGPTPVEAPPRTFTDRIPVLGWLRLRREHSLHGRGFWIRPMAIELALGLGLAALYWWEVDQQGLVRQQAAEILRGAINGPFFLAGQVAPEGILLGMFLSHALLIVLMAAASFIDIDEKIIPDEITVPGTLLGLLLAAALPMSLLPHVDVRNAPPAVGEAVVLPAAAGMGMFVEPVTLTAPNEWPEQLAGAPCLGSLAIGLACWWLWCFALAPRIWRGRHGVGRAVKLILRRVLREIMRAPLGVIAWGGSAAIAAVWWWGPVAWVGLLTALVGLAASGGVVWIVRLVGTGALGREAMGFGDVTLMMMVGTFVGWQAGLIIFFVAPFAALVVGLFQLLLSRDDVIPYGPFLCLGTLVVIVRWADFWTPGLQGLFSLEWLMPAVLLVCFVLLGVMLFVWQQIKNVLFR